MYDVEAVFPATESDDWLLLILQRQTRHTRLIDIGWIADD
jgi:hypothetical protein